ncbi:MAG: ribosome-binding factor A [Betaproteobacteria bacterium CG2_30_59_46]|nr:MAG: ribosome-binding factor A [Betaproteobacteria bacterium CG2_30_59_46]PIQ12330.1 MAG: ribosome-binding factor A [Hydrogenophilales bacterium CG18_big_fil_WC_8_21_14_2_50_58_12]PIY01267.1 MAG: ribosome-binding factor A [Hydrogenophilales bacterium CG_4_10_14_3_um_filter_58_23]PJB07947.1 MAG: ribosome-binding factor A [Hydrogenophilales bacterium CG_4_9_14_3_um_filter_59_35]
MGKAFLRTGRIAEQIQRELADLIQMEVKDPRAGLVTLTGVEVTQDYSHAKVYFTTMKSADQAPKAQAGLEHAAGFLRSQLAHRMKLRIMPQLHFIYDTSVENGVRLSRLIDEAVAADKAHQREE